MADWWQPTRARYLGRVSKQLVLEALTEAVSRQCADGLRWRKRDSLIEGWLAAGGGNPLQAETC